jgi:PTH1 family peptidyl-tRNA hydrolase
MPEPEFIVVGLGNPGPEYEWTPHNLGFLAVDRVAERNGIRIRRSECRAAVGQGAAGGRPVLLAKPLSFMNLSGQPVERLLARYGLPPGALVVVHDDLDLGWGALRIRPGGSAGGHHGVEDIIRCLGTQDFARVRLGINPGHPVRDGAQFVLAPMRGEQRKQLDELLDAAGAAVESLIAGGVEKAMAAHNRRAPGKDREAE